MTFLTFQRRLLVAAFAFGLFGWETSRADHQVSVPQFKAQPGGNIAIPLSLDNSASVASIKIKVNYDRQILDFVSAQNNAAAGGFDLVASEDDGVITLMLSRASSQSQGAGKLVTLNFHVNAGARAGMSSALTLAGCELSDDSGLRNLNLEEKLVLSSGQIAVTLGAVDNNNNKIPDDWEAAQGLSTTEDGSIEVGAKTGFSAYVQYAFGLTPSAPDRRRLPKIAVGDYSDGKHLTVQFHRRRSAGNSLEYVVEESTDLASWSTVDCAANQVGAPVVEDADFDLVTVRGNLLVNSDGGPRKGFMRVRVVCH